MDTDRPNPRIPLSKNARVVHEKSHHCPVLTPGRITPQVLHQWMRSCQRYKRNSSSSTIDADLVAIVADEMRDPLLEK
jgi:hypothetical protein